MKDKQMCDDLSAMSSHANITMHDTRIKSDDTTASQTIHCCRENQFLVGAAHACGGSAGGLFLHRLQRHDHRLEQLGLQPVPKEGCKIFANFQRRGAAAGVPRAVSTG